MLMEAKYLHDDLYKYKESVTRGNIIPSLKVKHNGNHEIWLVHIVCPICQKFTGLWRGHW